MSDDVEEIEHDQFVKAISTLMDVINASDFSTEDVFDLTRFISQPGGRERLLTLLRDAPPSA